MTFLMQKLLLIISIYFIFLTGYSQEKSNFSFSGGLQSNMLHSPRFQQLLNSNDISKIGGKIGNGMFIGAKYDFSNFQIDAKVFREGFDLSNSNYLARDFPVVLRGYEAGIKMNLFPKIKFFKVYSGVSYHYSAIGSTITETNSTTGETDLLPSFVNSVSMKFPSINFSLESNRSGIINFFIDASQPMDVKSKTFSKISVGILLF